MGCPAEVEISDNLVFSICTHDPDTGGLTDADAAPVYWIYEDETGVSINASTPNSDSMAKLDDAHTTGFYSELIACTAANGYEHGKTYTIYIEATVDGDTGGICYGFKAVTAPLSLVVDNDETDISVDGAFKLLLSVLTGKSSGGGTATIVFRDIADSKNRISATVDGTGNRTAIGTRDAT